MSVVGTSRHTDSAEITFACLAVNGVTSIKPAKDCSAMRTADTVIGYRIEDHVFTELAAAATMVWKVVSETEGKVMMNSLFHL